MTKRTTGAQGAPTTASIDPTNDAHILAGTLSCAMQDNADQRHMLDEETFKLNPEPDGSAPQEMGAIAIYDGLARCITQSRGIVGCLGSLDLDGPIDELSLGDASWAVKDLLEQASTYAIALLEIAKLHEGGTA